MMSDRFTLDTNILVYAADRDAGRRHELAVEIVDRAIDRSCVLTLQSLSEFFHATTRKGLLSRREAANQVRDWLILFPVVAADRDALAAARSEAQVARLSLWDALFLSTAHRAGCTIVLSEDMQDGFPLIGLTVRNPFAGDGLPGDLAALLGMPVR